MSRPTSLVGRLIQHAETDPDRCAIASADEALSYAELAERVIAQARRLEALDVGGDPSAATRVTGILCDQDIPHLVAVLAVAQCGASSCTLPSYESAEQRQRTLQRAGVSTVIAGDGSVEHVPIDPGAPSDPVLVTEHGAKLLFSTSGTTGVPKIVCHSDSGLVAQAHRHVGPAERFACLATMEHNFAKRHRLYCVAEGATNVFLDTSPNTLVQQRQSLEFTTLHVTAFQAHELLAVPGVEALRGVRLKLGGSHVPASLRDSLRRQVTPTVQFGYGTTETGAIAFTEPRDLEAAESVGQALSGIEVRVLSAAHEPIGQGESGAIAIRCSGLFLGYLGQPQLTAQRRIDGWFHTGDVGHLDDQGRLHLGGRTDDMFVFNSMNIHPQDIEAQILEHPAVIDVVVVPQRSPVHGDVPVALVVLDPASAPDLRDLKSFVRTRTGVRCPKRFSVVERIPRNAAGKVLRAEALQLLLNERAR